MSIADVANAAEAAVAGKVVSRIVEDGRVFDVVVKFDDNIRDSIENIKNMPIDTPFGFKVPLSALAEVVSAKGPNSISRENVQRKIIVQANVSGRDLRSVYEDIRGDIERNLRLPAGYYIEYGGQFEAEAEAARMIGLLSIASLLLIILILYIEFRSFKTAALVMINLPFALIGGILAVFFTGGVINISSMVGFITLFGIATRNGILLISHYQHLLEVEGKPFKEAVLQGSMERLRPVLMTALTAGLALVPFAIASDKPGNEILSPLAIVILGGLFSSTALNMMVLPSLYIKYGKKKMK
jgi:Cu/Ag efflux pump CusA